MRSTIAARSVRYALLFVLWAGAASAQDGQTPSSDPFARRAWTLELAAHGAIETWNYNISHEEMLSTYAGITYGVGRGVVLKLGTPVYRVWQRGTDAYLVGLTWGARGRVARKARWSAYWEFDVGISEADTYVPPGGTRFNYLALGGGGLTLRLRPGADAYAGLRWVHVSNSGIAGRHRNPDIEAVGPALGLLVGF